MEFQSEIWLSHSVEIEFHFEIALLHSMKIEFQHNTHAFLTGKPPASPPKPFRPNENPLPTIAGHHSDAQTGTPRPEPTKQGVGKGIPYFFKSS